MVDQCFLELSPGEPDRLVRELEGGGLLLLRALTKSYAMAGLRLGYCLSDDRALLAAMAEEGPALAGVTAGTQAGISAFTGCAGLAISRPPAVGGGAPLSLSGTEQAAVPRLPKRLHFLLFQGEEGWRERLLDRGILIRSCADFQGLGPGLPRLRQEPRGK